jgi:signal recognition particle subunit SRP54
MGQIKNMGGLSSLLSMMPGVSGQISDDMLPDEKQLGKIEAIIYSMTKEERGNPDLINPSRKRRIANGAGVDISEVNKLVKQFEQARKMMKSMPALMGGKGKGRRKGGFKMPFGF